MLDDYFLFSLWHTQYEISSRVIIVIAHCSVVIIFVIVEILVVV